MKSRIETERDLEPNIEPKAPSNRLKTTTGRQLANKTARVAVGNQILSSPLYSGAEREHDNGDNQNVASTRAVSKPVRLW